MSFRSRDSARDTGDNDERRKFRPAVATFAQHASTVSLVTVFGGGPDFVNTYAVIVGDGAHAPEAGAFADWLSDGAGRDVIGRHRVGDEKPAFFIWPAGRPRRSPLDLPE